MSQNDDLGAFPESFEAYLCSFESAWQRSGDADWSKFCSECPSERSHLKLALLQELTAIDMEFRWKAGRGRPIEDYLRVQPRLIDPPRLLELIGDEYRARHRFTKPDHKEYQRRFPQLGELVAIELARVDDELQREKVPASLIVDLSPIRPIKHFVPDPQATLNYRDYVIKRFLGAGGSGKVYCASHRSREEKFAIKFLKKQFLSQPEVIRRFLVEAKMVEQLRHPGIVGVHGLGSTPWGGYFLVMDWLPAGDLNHKLRNGQISIRDAVRWVREIALAIGFAHERGIVHCDLKPANVVLDRLGHAVITDFGLARSDFVLDQSGFQMEGTASYMAMEQVAPGSGQIGPWTDIYALGAILYSLLTGRAPYIGKRPSDVLSQLISNRTIPDPSSYRSQITIELDAICLECLNRDPARRPASAYELERRLCAIAESSDRFDPKTSPGSARQI